MLLDLFFGSIHEIPYILQNDSRFLTLNKNTKYLYIKIYI